VILAAVHCAHTFSAVTGFRERALALVTRVMWLAGGLIALWAHRLGCIGAQPDIGVTGF
jgi:hypothetical protein